MVLFIVSIVVSPIQPLAMVLLRPVIRVSLNRYVSSGRKPGVHSHQDIAFLHFFNDVLNPIILHII